MKKFITICTLCLVPALFVGLTGCKTEVGENSGYVLQDAEVYPKITVTYEAESESGEDSTTDTSGVEGDVYYENTAPYEEESREVLQEYLDVANEHLDGAGDIDTSDEEVQEAAKIATAQLYAYACYNEEYLDKYVYFSDQTGKTDLGSTGSSTATKQDYKLIIHDSTTVCGYKYHYTIKNVDEATGLINNDIIKSQFESCKLRFVEAETNCLYRFNGDDVEYDDDGYLTCTWSVDSSQKNGWGSSVDEPAIVKRSKKLNLDGIAEDIVTTAQEDPSNAVIHGCINILADDIISSAYLVQTEIGDTGYMGYTGIMVIDTDVANADEASMSMLQEANSSSDCKWSDGKLSIAFQIWDNGLFYQYTISETWEGKISGFSGSAKSSTTVKYSYSDSDTDMTEKLAMLASAKESVQ